MLNSKLYQCLSLFLIKKSELLEKVIYGKFI